MELIKITSENIENEHICCAISKNDDPQVCSKKDWLKDRIKDGLVFLKCNVRGKSFIEYIPAEYAWAPIRADGYIYIDCLWVSGQFKGHGYSNLLMDECIRDAKEKGKKGLCVLSSDKKVGFLSDPKYLVHKGFSVCDSAKPYFKLMYLPFGNDGEKPSFMPQLKSDLPTDKDGFVIYYTNQCPFTAKYVPILVDAAKNKGIPLKAVHISSTEEAKKSLSPFTTFSLFYNGEFITHEILSVPKFEKIAEKFYLK